MRKQLPVTHGDGGSIESEGADRQGFRSAQIGAHCADIASFTSAVAEDARSGAWRSRNLSEIWGGGLLNLEKENASDFKWQSAIGKTANNAQAVDEDDVIHAKMMEFEFLLEASGERNLRSINLTHGECSCHCLAQTVWYPEQSNLCLIWDVEEIRSTGLTDHQQ